MKIILNISFLIIMTLGTKCKSQNSDTVQPVEPLKVRFKENHDNKIVFCDTSTEGKAIGVLSLIINNELIIEEVGVQRVMIKAKDNKSFQMYENENLNHFFKSNNFLKNLEVKRLVESFDKFPYKTIIQVPVKIEKRDSCKDIENNK